jgi:Rad3-related DNA helicase
MSATIGNPAPLAHMLGIDDYKFSTFEHPVPAQYRPVFDLKFPRMSKRVLHENPKFYEIQSKGIQKWIQQFPPNWRGVILTSSYYKIKKIMEFMPENERRFIVQGQGQRVNDITTKFITDVRPGDIMVGTIQGMGSGLNLKGDLARWLVIASVANINPTDEYMKVRRHKFGGRTYEDWITYNAIVQAAGRISRGTRDENGEYITNYVALADGKATVNRAMAMYSDWFKEAIV